MLDTMTVVQHVCVPGCHPSCLGCVLGLDGSGSVCVDCGLDKVLKGSECVSNCGSGHYAKDGRCKGWILIAKES